ncbi:winged helix-turn-helix domain-containing protein [Phytohabitans kaempferiae]|uniref:Winged helix-turn-helix domain-containing protein n=1 Tax=Phytohabitans kaempferiae TaxID=1620943 RepID=A0ABV6M883_9ACTN
MRLDSARLSGGDARRGSLGDARRQAAHWCRRNRAGGDGTVAAARRRYGVLTRAQELRLIETIRDRFPDQLKLTGPLWSRQTVAALVERLYGIPLSPAATARYLRAWGLTPREPVDRACPLCAASVVRWQAQEYQAISHTAQRQRAELCWAGKTRLHGVTPATDVVSAVSARGRIRFMVTTEADLPREFLTRLLPTSGRPAHVIVDGSWSCTEWPRRVPEGVVLHALPTCERGR